MKTGLFFFGALVGVTVLLAYLLRKWVKTNIGSRHPRDIAPGEGFFFYEHGQQRYGVCDANYSCIEVIYTTDNKRVEYRDISKLRASAQQDAATLKAGASIWPAPCSGSAAKSMRPIWQCGRASRSGSESAATMHTKNGKSIGTSRGGEREGVNGNGYL